MRRGSRNRKILVHGFLWNSPKNVQAEFQAEGVDKIGERLEAGFVSGGRKGVHGRRVAAETIQTELGLLRVYSSGVIGHVPSRIDDDILPAELLEMLSHPFCVGA